VFGAILSGMALRLTDEQWDRIYGYLPEENIPDGRPRRKPIPARHVLEGALWILSPEEVIREFREKW